MARTTRKRKIRFIVNPIAGNSQKETFPVLVGQVLNRQLFNWEVIFTEHAGHASELSREAVEHGTDIVVAVGGDGTINEVARCLVGTNTVLGIIPSGSGNGLARHLNIPLNFEGALKLINTGEVVKIDTATINDRVFISIAGVGFDALVAKLFAQKPTRGFFTYFKIVAQRFQSYRPKTYKLILDGHTTIKSKALFISLANSNQFGYNTTIAPNAKLNDGLIDVCIVQKPNIFEMPLIINLLFLNMIHRSRFVQIHRAAEVQLIRKKNRVVNLDGEPVRLTNNLTVRVNPLSLNIIIPQKNE
ncbi:MAG: diacylglycerol kinase family lipid kinase [Bacteroidetes bacterium]|nr:diacylglycerol kinase family lipid kinase [Bacteroidales bacterium]MBU1011201.1 diacylglycerol kinase family lipid kinase [Bacteroidota bacterium]